MYIPTSVLFVQMGIDPFDRTAFAVAHGLDSGFALATAFSRAWMAVASRLMCPAIFSPWWGLINAS